MIKLKDLLRISSFSDKAKVKMTILQHKPNVHYKKLLKDIRKTESNIVLSVNKDKIVHILRQVNLNDFKFIFII